MAWTAFIWLRIRVSCVVSEHGKELSVFINMCGISELAEKL
jgi:hypothetical protein